MLRLMASEQFGEVVAMKEAVLEAIGTLELMGKNGPALGLLNDLGIAHRNMGQYDAAIGFYQQVMMMACSRHLRRQVASLAGGGAGRGL